MDNKTRGQKIEEARIKAKMTQEAVAALFAQLGTLSRQAVENWEAGKSFPEAKRWPTLEKGMGLPDGWFYQLRSGTLPAVQVNGVNNVTMQGIFQTTEPQPGHGDIARDLCNMIASRLEGMDIEAQIALRARVKAALDEQRPTHENE